MQKKIIALAVAAAFSAPAFADNANVTFYGKVDVDFESVKNDKGANATTQPVKMNRVATNASRFGIKGSEDLGGGMSAFFQYEVQMDANGNSGNGLGNGTRNSGVGLKGDFGQIIFGIWDTPYKVAHNKVEIFDNTHFASTTSVLSRSSGAATTATTYDGAGVNFNTRLKNSIQYASPTFGGFDVKVAYGADNAAAPATATTVETNKRVLSVSGTYESDMLYVAVANEQHNDEAVPATATVKGSNAATRLVGAYKFGEAGFVGVTLENMTIKTIAGGVVTSNTRKGTELSGSYKFDAHRIGAAYAKMGDLGNNVDTGATQASLRYGYNFSKRTEAYAMYSRLSNKANGRYDFSAGNTLNGAVGTVRTGLGLGVVHSF